MSHHANEMTEDMRRRINAMLGNASLARLGATGEYPRGKLTEEDEGEIQIAIAADPKTRTVLINFGKPVAWIGFSAEQASDIADLLIAKANQIRGIE